MVSHFKPEPFNPPLGLRGPHSQSIWGKLTRHVSGVSFQREIVDTPDGGFITLDYADVYGKNFRSYGDDWPIVFCLHGLEGNAQSDYLKTLYTAFAESGFRSVGINYRSCDGIRVKTPRFYHCYAIEDIAFMVRHLRQRFPHAPLLLLGVSLGAVLTLNYLGQPETDNGAHITAAATISPVFDLNKAEPILAHGSGRFYGQMLLYSLKQKARYNAAILQGLIDLDRIQTIKTLRDFDEFQTAPLHGFADATDYYTQASPAQRLHNITTPTLILRSKDDPFFDPTGIPHDLLAGNRWLTPVITQYGGHVGFTESYAGASWAGRQVTRFFDQLI